MLKDCRRITVRQPGRVFEKLHVIQEEMRLNIDRKKFPKVGTMLHGSLTCILNLRKKIHRKRAMGSLGIAVQSLKVSGIVLR